MLTKNVVTKFETDGTRLNGQGGTDIVPGAVQQEPSSVLATTM